MVEPRAVAAIAALIEDGGGRGAYDPPSIRRRWRTRSCGLANAFLYNDAVAGIRGRRERLRDVEAALLGLDCNGVGRP